MFDIVGIGGSFHDNLLLMERFPVENTKMNRVVEVIQQGGGPVSTGLCAASRLGARCAIMSTFGDDSGGDFLKGEFLKDNVDISSSVTRPGASSNTCYVIVSRDSGYRTICGAGGTVGGLKREEIDFELIRAAKVLLIDGSSGQAGIYGAQFARENGVKVMLDAEMPGKQIREMIKHTDFLITSEECMYEYGESDDMKTCLTNAFSKGRHDIVGATLGEKGGIVYDGENFIEYPIYPAKVVDTNGCGDVFHGAFAYGYLQGFSTEKNCHFSSGVASMKCMKLGGRSGIPTMPQLVEWLTPYYDLAEHV